MIFPNNITFAGQKVAVCNRYIEQYREEHNAHPLKVVARARRAELNALLPEAYHGHRLIWLITKWLDVLNGNEALGFPGVPLDTRLAATEKKDEVYAALKVFYKWQREEHGPTVRGLIQERNKAFNECRQDTFHNPTLGDFTVANGKRVLNVPSQNPHNEATNSAFAMRAFETIPDMDEEHREAVFEAIAEARHHGRNSTFWDAKIDKELVRNNLHLPEPPDPPEDFTEVKYTKVDGGGANVTVAAQQIDFTNLSRQEETYVSGDFGVDHFGDVDHLHSAELTADTASSIVYIYSLTNVVDDATGMNADDVLLVRMLGATNQDFIQFRQFDGGVSQFSDNYVGYSLSHRYWFNTSRASTSAQCLIYNDADSLDLEDTLAGTCTTTKYRHYAPLAASNDGTGSQLATGSIYATDLQEEAGAVIQRRRQEDY